MCFVCVSSISLQKSAGLHIRLCANRASVQAASTAPERLTIDLHFAWDMEVTFAQTTWHPSDAQQAKALIMKKYEKHTQNMT